MLLQGDILCGSDNILGWERGQRRFALAEVATVNLVASIYVPTHSWIDGAHPQLVTVSGLSAVISATSPFSVLTLPSFCHASTPVYMRSLLSTRTTPSSRPSTLNGKLPNLGQQPGSRAIFNVEEMIGWEQE
ncbi:hypothetical protein P691DRAFT_67317 [Macrolepiota fuliginosa MF-IS2]|uniref:Uncharacterized protein n=1 Tax=Macrolepiota fuliginosa MF-IS2 TaxID=1400762 RepID=A0A9P6BWR3_9AGAR|nr:hypothetical protein P691DRAFT_67317 [Macrolepiota fuliginosa MF-IS2]